jgi:hypothetical protein
MHDEIKLRRLWISQLYKEHENICWRYRVKLDPPIIELVDSGKYFGIWKSGIRTIKLSERLIEEHSWDVVVNVLKHEMAHQIVTEYFKSDEKHGELFHQACRMIGVPEQLRRATGDLPQGIRETSERDIDSDTRKILEKVRKLLSLAQSKNEHESFLAMKKANELIEKYNIDRLERNTDSKYTYKIINPKKKRIENYQRRICLILRDYFYVYTIFSRIYHPGKCDYYKTIELCGTIENVLMAEYVYYFLLEKLASLWEYHQSNNGSPGSKKRSYWLGVVDGFRDKLGKMEKEKNGNGKYKYSINKTTSALVCADDLMLKEFIDMRFPRLSNRRHQPVKIDHHTYKAGKKDGKKINLHRGICRKEAYQGKLIGI